MLKAPACERVTDLVAHWASATPQNPAWAYEDDTATYAELQEQVRMTAKALIAQGVGAGDRVAMLTTPRPEYWQTFLATVSIGAIWIGLNPRYRVRELEHVIADSSPRLLIALDLPERPELVEELDRIGRVHGVAGFVRFGSHPQQWADFIAGGTFVDDVLLDAAQDKVTGDDPALLVYTSGSTGKPKGAVLGHRGLCASFRIQAQYHASDVLRVIANLPVNHIGGVGDLCCTPLTTGGLIVFQQGFDPDQMFDAIEKHGVTALMQVPTTLKLLSEHPRFATSDLSSIRSVNWGGGPLPLQVIKAWRKVADVLGVTYGMTEITGSVTYSDPEATDEELCETVGRPVAELDVRLVTEDGDVAPAGVQGEVQVRHPGALLEYFGNPEATASVFTEDGFVRTGDVGVLRQDGNLTLVGRMKEMYKSGGYNVYPREIELVLEAHPHVRMAAVVATPHPLYDEVGHAFVEATAEHVLAVEDLRAWCAERLANYKVPKAFTVLEQLPLLPVGKVDKKLLQSRSARRD